MSNLVKDVFRDYEEKSNITETQVINVNLYKKSKKIEIELKTENNLTIKEISNFEEYLKTRFQIQKIELNVVFGNFRGKRGQTPFSPRVKKGVEGCCKLSF